MCFQGPGMKIKGSKQRGNYNGAGGRLPKDLISMKDPQVVGTSNMS